MPSFWAKCDIVTPPTEKWAFFRTFSRAPPPGGETCEILLANYKGPPMPFHYLYNWLLPLARFRKSRPDKNRYRKKTRHWQAMACRERRRRRPPSWNGLALLSLLSNLPPLSYDGLSHTSRTFRKKITNLTPLEKMDSPNFPTCHPSTNGLGRTPRTFRKNFPNLTPLVKMDSPYCHYFPTCHRAPAQHI